MTRKMVITTGNSTQKTGLLSLSSLSPAERDSLSQSIHLEESHPGWGYRAIILAVAGLLGLFIIWSALTQIDETVVARGEVLPINFVQPVQHLEGGIVASVLVSDGQKVEKGDPLVVMDKTSALSDFLSFKVREASLALQIARLHAFALGQKPDFSEYADEYPDLVRDQMAIFNRQNEARLAQLTMIDSQVSSRQQEVVGLEKHLDTLDKQLMLLVEELEMRQILLDKGLTNKVVYLDTQRRYNQVEGEIARTHAEIARATADVAQANANRLQIDERLRSEALEQLGRFSNEQAEVHERLSALSDRLDRTIVRAPISGLVAGLAVTGPGAVLAPGVQIAKIVPDGREVLAEGRISPRDIGHVEVGQPVTVKIDTYDYTRFGGVPGTVHSISATSFKDEEGRPYFRSLIAIEQPYIGRDIRNNAITPGMTLVADIKTGEKSLLGYLWRPVQQSLDGAFSER